MNNLFYIILKKDFKDNLLSNKAWFTISFFLLCLIIFPLAFGSSQYLELNISISAIWISTLFANLIALDHMYKEDYNDGTLLYYIVNKIILIAPLCSYIFSGYSENNLNLFIGLILATPIFTLIGSPIAALMLGSSLRGAALTFITLPFYLPIIIFGVMGTNINNSNINAEFYLLLAILSIGIIFFPMITVKILKNIIN